MPFKRILFLLGLLLITINCAEKSTNSIQYSVLEKYANILDYKGTPDQKFDKKMLMFSDQGAWFAYSLPTTNDLGFSGPFLMTQENGVWLAKQLSNLSLNVDGEEIPFELKETNSYHSHLESMYTSKFIDVIQRLVFQSGHSA